MKLDILAIVAHPDDAELGCGATLAKHSDLGYNVGVLDLTRGELGTRGTSEIREKEAEEASRILGLKVRENMGFMDGFFQNDPQHQMKLIERIRFYRPDIVLTNALEDRHPDHGRAAALVKESCFLAGLEKISTYMNGEGQQAWRPKHIYHFIQYKQQEATLVVNVEGYEARKRQALEAYKSQFYNKDSKETETLISSKTFMDMMMSRIYQHGNLAAIPSGEAFYSSFLPATDHLFELL